MNIIFDNKNKNNTIKIKYFNDGEIYFTHKLKGNIKKVFLIFYINKNIEKEIFKIFMVIEILKKYGVSKIFLLVPYLRFSRQDRFVYSSPLKLFIKILDKLKTNMLITFDIHSEQTIGFSENLIIKNISLFPEIIKILKNIKKKIIFTDIGGYNRYKKYLNNESFIVLNKSREKRKINIINNNNIINNDIRHIIFDDIIDSGNTILESILKLKKTGVKRIYVFSVHPIFSNIFFLKKIDKIKILKKVFVFKTIKKKIKTKKIILLKLDKIIKKIFRNV
ncbi:ribose-phosphate diphosphokinase [Candidatus Vidania fulgoroideorum]